MEPPKEEVLQMENFVARLTAAAHRKCLHGEASRLDSPANRLLPFISPATNTSENSNASPPNILLARRSCHSLQARLRDARAMTRTSAWRWENLQE